MSRLTLDLHVGESLLIGEVRIHLEKKSGQIARLVIEAGESVDITPPRRKAVANQERKSAPNLANGA